MVFLCLRRDKSLECEGKKMNIERQIEFDKVKEIWAELAVTDWAKERIREATLFFSETELKKKLRDTTDARFLIEKLGMPPLQNMTEIKEALLIAEKGDCLTPYQCRNGFSSNKAVEGLFSKGKDVSEFSVVL